MVPKAQVTYADEGEESTTNDAWEEPSTTTEQGEVAERIRAFRAELSRRSEDAIPADPAASSDVVTGDPEARVTMPRPRQHSPEARVTLPRRAANTIGTSEEPTIEDQRALAVLNAAEPPRKAACLVVTDGSDAGKSFDLQPGKTYTIGRAIDNDIVLTDISVSRKHFDLRFEDGAWRIRDRGSGNGTLINGLVEDRLVQLANGDAIEIGNTLFRFEAPELVRPAPVGTPRIEHDRDADLATVAGKRRPTEIQAVPQSPLPPLPEPRMRSVTRPPPPPSTARARTQSNVPPIGPEPSGRPVPAAPIHVAVPTAPAPASTMPMPPMPQMVAHHPPLSPVMLGDARVLPPPAATLPPPATRLGPAMSYGYPPAATLPSQLAPTQMPSFAPSMLVMPSAQVRPDPSTAHVPPTPYYPVALPGTPPQYVP
ncbi:MAG: FHA domain-containing protein, partial [Kofleriaceae bacterium]